MPTRRDFLRTTALAGSALVVGVRWDGASFAVEAPSGSFTPNAWIRIESSGKTFLTIGKSEMGQGVRTSLAMILADELDADWSQIELVQASPGPNFKRLGTGGSWSVGGSWAPLRLAGAAARTMLVDAAAARWGVAASECKTSNGKVSHGGKSLRYGELAGDAAKLKVPEKPALKPMDAMNLVGKSTSRLDARRIVNGSARYGIDAVMPGMLYASLERPPVRGATLVRVDAEAAKRVSGVVDVVTIPAGVAVVARNTWAAMKGRAALKAEWHDGANAAFDSTSHWAALEAAAEKPGVVTRKEGTMPADAAHVVEATYHYPFSVHAPLEPMSAVASLRDGRCKVITATQQPNRAQEQVAAALGLKPEDVDVEVTLLGGGFGRRLAADYAVEAALLSKEIGKPVQVLWTRADDMHFGHFQMAAVHRMWATVEPLAWKHKKVSSPHNINPVTMEDAVSDAQNLSWGVYDNPYGFTAMETAYVAVDVPVRIGPWRAVFAPSSVFARECFMDELAHAAGKDPVAFRLALLEGGVFKAGSLSIDRARLRNVLRLAAEKSGWGTPLPAGRGRGIACNVYDGDTHTAYVAEVSAPNVVHRIVAVIDCGVAVNPRGIEQQVESGAIWALSNLMGEITFARGRAQQDSYADFPVLRMSGTPSIETHIVPSHGEQPFGIGEPVVPPVIPAVLNALFAATGKRVRRLPL